MNLGCSLRKQTCLVAASALLLSSVVTAQVFDTPTGAASSLQMPATVQTSGTTPLSDTTPRSIQFANVGDGAGICGRTRQVREAIIARIDGVSDCADVTDAHLSQITDSLHLESSGITALRAGDFAGLSSLTLLSLYDNALTRLPSGLLSGLSSLDVLYLDSNDLIELPDDLMAPVPRLNELWLRKNLLTEFPPGFFADKTGLSDLQVYHNPGDPDLKSLDPVESHRGNPLGVHVYLKALGEGRFSLSVPVGTAFETVVSLEATNGILADDTITIPAGRLASDVITVSREDGTSSAVTVDIVDVRASRIDTRPPWFPRKLTPMFHNGIVITKAGDLPMEVLPGRKPQVSIAPREGDAPVTEGTAVAYTLTRERPHDSPLTVTVDVSQTGEMIKSTDGYQVPDNVYFGANESTAVLMVETQNDTLDEPHTTITATVTATADSAYTVGETAASNMEVQDDDETTATITAVSLTSDLGTADTYAIGDTIRASAAFSVGLSGPITVSGRPQLALTLGSAARKATYESGTGSTNLVFSYTVAEGDATSTGIAIAADSLSLNGGTIANAGGDANLAHAALAADPAHTVDGLRPALTAAATSEDGRSLVLTYSEALDLENPPAQSAFAVTMNGTEVALSDTPAVNGSQVTLRFVDPLRYDTSVVVSYTDPSAADDSGTVSDRYGNDAASETVTATNNVSETAGPYLDLLLGSPAIIENGGVSTVTAILTRPAVSAFEVTVAADAVAPALARDFSLSGNTTLRFADGAVVSTGEVSITAMDNDLTSDDKIVIVSGTVADGSGVQPPPDLMLTIRDDETSFVEVCDRTAAVRDALMQETRAGSCEQATQTSLLQIEGLNLSHMGITSLKNGDFAGLANVRKIFLNGNQLQTLPANSFHGLPLLRTLWLHGNPSLSLPPVIFFGLKGLKALLLHRNLLPVDLEKVSVGRFKATIATGAPFDMNVRVAVTNGALPEGLNSLTIPAGSLESETIDVTRTGTAAVEVDIAGFPPLVPGHRYYSFVKADGLPLEVIEEMDPVSRRWTTRLRPEDLSVVTTDHSVQMGWTLPEQSGDDFVEEMHLERLEAGDAVVWSGHMSGVGMPVPGRSYKRIVRGLSEATDYRFRVRLLLDTGEEVYSEVLGATTETGASLGASNLSAVAMHSSVSLDFTIPEQPEWVTDATYQASMRVVRQSTAPLLGEREDAGSVTWQRGVTTYSFTDMVGIHPGQSYRYRVEVVLGDRLHLSDWVSVTLPAQPDDPDGDRVGAATLDAAAAARRVVYTHGHSLHGNGGDTVDYYTFTTTARHTLDLGVRVQSIDLDVTLEDGDGDTVIESWSPPGQPRHQVVKTVIEPGTYYIRIEATEDDLTGYYIRFGLSETP